MEQRMEDTLYSVDEVAEILHLHPRTVRIYLNEGKLAGRKIGKEWRISRAALNSFLGDEGVNPEVEESSGRAALHVSAVIDLPARDREQATRLSNTILAALKGKGPEYSAVRFDFIYYEDERKARCVFWGDPVFIGNLLLLIGKIME